MKLRNIKKSFVIPMNAMSDVAFLLLIFIMLVALINYRKEVKIEYPEAENAKRTSIEKNMELWVDVNGEVYIDGTLSDLSTVEDVVSEVYLNAPDTRIHILADRNTPFEKVNGVLSVLQLLQYRVVSLVVKD